MNAFLYHTETCYLKCNIYTNIKGNDCFYMFKISTANYIEFVVLKFGTQDNPIVKRMYQCVPKSQF